MTFAKDLSLDLLNIGSCTLDHNCQNFHETDK
jgi:hypothetical protein